MCGIAGILQFDPLQEVDTRLLRRMTTLIAHRGPDAEGYYVSGNVGLGHRRLAIIDLSDAGRQPMANDDQSVWLTYNGECYNYSNFYSMLRAQGYKFRSSTDTEVLLNLYDYYGIDFLSHIDGMFALALWDARKQRLILARDRLGIKPLYYYADSSHLIFASELKALLADPLVGGELDYHALLNYFQYMSIPDANSIVSGVKRLMPGHYLYTASSGVEIRQYWDVHTFEPKLDISFAAACEEFRQRFGRTVVSHMIADVPVGAFLSGGVDSSAVAVAASRATSESLATFSVAFTNMREFDESHYAHLAAESSNAQHHEFDLTPNIIDSLPKVVWHADEPFAISSALGVYFLSEQAHRYSKVVLTGDGGDEVFAGYPWRHKSGWRLPLVWGPLTLRFFNFLDTISQAQLNQVSGYSRVRSILIPATQAPSQAYKWQLSCLQPEEVGRLINPELWNSILTTSTYELIDSYYSRPQQATELDRKLYVDLKTTLISEMLTKVDRMTMAFGLEARVPFLDHHLVEWAFRLPDTYRIEGRAGKRIVKKAFEPDLPTEILYRPKHGFNVPMGRWIRQELREMVLDLLSVGRIAKRNIIQPTAVQGLLQRHFNGTQDLSSQIFQLLALELWLQQYVDNRNAILSGL